MPDWKPIAAAQSIRGGTIADLKMSNGRVYRATWGWRGNMMAWWPDDARRKSPIGLYNPVEFRPVAIGMEPPPVGMP